MFNFEKLIAYQETKKLVVNVYALAEKITAPEGEVVKKQIKKAVVEVPCSIAQGMSLATTNEKIAHLDIAYCNIARVYTLLQMAVELKYITASALDAIAEEMLEISKVVLGLKRKLKGDSYSSMRDDYSSRADRSESADSMADTIEI